MLLSRRIGWLSSLCLALVPALLQAAGTESRIFAVQVDGKQAGECRLSFITGEDGSETLSGNAAVRVKHLVAVYQYRYEGSEVWKGNRLQKLNCATDDNGTKCSIQATAEAAGLRVTANGRAAVVRADVWPTTYWRLPAAGLPAQALALLDVDNGRAQNARIDIVGSAKVMVAGQAILCTNYRLTGPVQVDLWYDAQGRLVRQSSVEDGHRTVLHLKEMPR